MKTIARCKDSKVQRHKGSMHECNNKHESSNKAQGAKATTRCKGAKVAYMKMTTSVKATRCKGCESNMHEGSSKCKGNSKAQGVKAIVRHEVQR
jgi:hypothetical protein